MPSRVGCDHLFPPSPPVEACLFLALPYFIITVPNLSITLHPSCVCTGEILLDRGSGTHYGLRSPLGVFGCIPCG